MAFTSLILDTSTGSVTSGMSSYLSDLSKTIGVDLFEEDIDNVVFQTNEFLCNADFIGSQGPSGGFSRCVWHWVLCFPLS